MSKLVEATLILGLLVGCGSTSSSTNAGTSGSSNAGGGSAGMAGSATAGTAGGAGTAGVGGTPALGASAAEACIAYALASCKRIDECAGHDSSHCNLSTLGCPESVLAAGSTRTPASLLACAETYATYPCEQLALGVRPACVAPGTRRQGESCGFHAQCASLNCETQGGERCGLCVSEVADGEDCSAPDVGCRTGSGCFFGKCVSFNAIITKKNGEACGDLDVCDGGYCLGGKCAGNGGENESCEATNTCAVGFYCGSANFICQKPALQDQPCLETASGTPLVCAAGLVCHVSADPASSTCGPPQALGQPCFMDRRRMVPLDGTCSAGNTCDISAMPPVCAPLLTAGARCGEGAECAAGLSCLCPDGAISCSAPKICGTLRSRGETCGSAGNICHPAFGCVANVCVADDSRAYANTCPP